MPAFFSRLQSVGRPHDFPTLGMVHGGERTQWAHRVMATQRPKDVEECS
jgi:hypothetical protein